MGSEDNISRTIQVKEGKRVIKLLIGVQDNAKTKANSLKAYSATEVDLNPDFNRVQSEAFTDSAYR